MTHRLAHNFWHCILNSSKSKHLTYKSYPFQRFWSEIRIYSSSEKDIEGLKSLKLKTFQTFWENVLFNSWFYFPYDRHKNLRTSLFWVFKKKKLPVWFSVKFVMLPMRSIVPATCLHNCHCTGLIGKPSMDTMVSNCKFYI